MGGRGRLGSGDRSSTREEQGGERGGGRNRSREEQGNRQTETERDGRWQGPF